MRPSTFKRSRPWVVLFASLCIVSTSLAGADGVLVMDDDERAGIVGEPILQQPPIRLTSGQQHKFSRPGATFIVVHLADIKLHAEDRLLIGTTVEDLQDAAYRLDVSGQAFVAPVTGGRAIVKLDCKSDDCAVTIDRIIRGLTRKERDVRSDVTQFLQACGDRELDNAVCYRQSDPEIYSHSRAVARLMRGGSRACTGWLLGSNGQLLTNYHCIKSDAEAAATTFEFLAEGDTCATECKEWGACPGQLRIAGATLIWADSALDYALLQLPAKLVSDFGWLKARTKPISKLEQVYIPQHPAAQGKKIAFRSGAAADASGDFSGLAQVNVSHVSSCRLATTVGCLPYHADTEDGSSGAPVIALSDHRVIGLHQCAGCPNSAIPITEIIADLKVLNILPPDSTDP